MPVSRPVAVVTGGNRGLGFEVARALAREGFEAVITSRDALAGKAAADRLQSDGLAVSCQPVDVTRPEAVERLADYLERRFERLDALVNNAGIFPEHAASQQGPGLLALPMNELQRHLDTNALGALRVSQALVPLMRRQGHGRIVNLTSGYAQLARIQAGFPAYRLSKALLNAITCQLAAELAPEGMLVNAVDPGWVRTSMGGPRAPREAAEAAADVVAALQLPADGPNGRLLRRGEVQPW